MQSLDFTTFILSISTNAYMGLGLTPPGIPAGHATPKLDLELARQNIDLLELLLVKTKGNLNLEEAQLLEHLLFETRMRFVEVSKNAKS